MSIFDPRPSYRVAQPFESARLALDLPLTPLNSLGQQFQRGLVDSFGLGTAIKDFSTPRGLPTGERGPLDLLRGAPVVGPLAEGYEALRGLFGAPTTGAPMSQEDWKASEFYRDEIQWDAGMTTDRAAAIATQYDIRKAREYFGSKDLLMTVAGGLAGGLFDPVNYVPVFGPGARLAATARFGTIIGHGLLGASEAAINTAVFGALSTPFRARLGEDVSWEAAINNIAFSAVIGAAFGSGVAAISRAASMRVAVAERDARMAMESIKNLQQSRDVLNDAVSSLINTGDVRLSDKSKTVLEAISRDVTDRRVAARALETETAGITANRPGEVAISPSGARIAVRPEVVEASTLQRATGSLQVRDRSADNAASNAQIEDIAIKLDPAKLMPAIDASQGAPIVGADNIVDSGNGRVAAIGRAYEAYPDRAAAYRQALIDAGYPEAAAMERPVLISRRVTDLSQEARAQFNADVNGPTTARMSAVELAAMDRAALTDDVMAQYAPGLPVTAAGNRAFVARFLAGLPLNERTGLVDRDGNLSADGVRRIENAMVAAAYGDVDMVALRKFAEATDDNTRSIVGALADVAGKWVTLRRAIARGEISADYDMTPELTEALRKLSGWRDQAAREGRPVSIVIKEGMAQGDLLAGDMPAATKLFVRSFYASGDFTQAAGRDTISARLNDLVDAALDLGQPDMLGDAYAATKLGVLKRVYNDVETDFLEAASVRTGTDDVGGAGRGFGLGAGGESRAQGIGPDGSRRYPAASPAERAASLQGLKAAQPARTFDELYAVAEGHQAALAEVGDALGKVDGIEWRNPGVKKRATSEAKLARKGYESTSELTDVVRGGFVVKTPGDAETIVDQLSRRFRVLDEGWNVTAAGYFDRKVLVQFDDGTIGEVQIWHPDMLKAKKTGHKLYEEMRTLKPDDPRFLELLDEQRALYLSAIEKSDDAWLPVVSRLVSELEDMTGGKPASGKASSNSAGDSTRPESMISAALGASRQSPPEAGRNQAEPPDMTAGRPSQSKNVVSMPADVGPDGAPTQGLAEVPDPMSSISRYMDGWVPSGERVSDMSTSRVTEPLYRAIEAAKTPDEAHLAADSWVLDVGNKNGLEHLVMFDGDAGLMMVGRGGERFVGIPDPLLRRIEAGEVRYATHNHPRNTGLSKDDLVMALAGSAKAADNMTVTAMGSKGAISTAGPGPAFAALKGKLTPEGWGDIGGAIAQIDATVRGTLQAMIYNNELLPAEAATVHAHMSNIIMHRLGWIDLRGNGYQIIKDIGLLETLDNILRGKADDFERVSRRAGFEFAGIRDFDPARRPGGTAEGSARADGGSANRVSQDGAGIPQDGGGARFRGGRRPDADPRQLTLLEQAARFAEDGGDDQADMFDGAAFGRQPPPTVDMQAPKPEVRPDGLDAAAARVGTAEDMRALGEQFGVDSKTGDFAELADLDALRSNGRLTPEDEDLLAAADQGYKDAEAWAESLRVAAACVMG